MQLKNVTAILSALTVFTFAAPIQADIKVTEMCDKMKSCVMESVSSQQIPEEMMKGIVDQVTQQCLTEFAKKSAELIEAGLEDKANACADSMIEMSCTDLMQQNDDNKTEACAEFEKDAKEAGIDLG